MGNRFAAYWIALAIFLADQLTKWLVLGPLDLRNVGQIYVLPIFNLTYTENYGISLGLFDARTATGQWILVAITAAIATGVAWWITQEKEAGDKLALGLVLGGAVGNILDRSRLGYVVDFADLHFGDFQPFLVFNVGDAAISIGVVILLLRAVLASKKRPEENIDHA